jgi:hypothetical protein
MSSRVFQGRWVFGYERVSNFNGDNDKHGDDEFSRKAVMDFSYVDQKLGDAVQLLFRHSHMHSMDHNHPLPTDESYRIINWSWH